MRCEMRTQLYEGKAKKIFSTEKPDEVVVYYKDDLTAFNAVKKGQFSDKGKINCEITTLIYKYLEANSVKTHLIKSVSENELLVQKVEIIPLEVVCRNYWAGSLAKRFKKQEGLQLKKPLVEFYYKDDHLEDPFVSDEQIIALELTSWSNLTELKIQALKINDLLKRLFKSVGILLADFKIEFGINQKGELLLADEITPDCCRLWDEVTMKKLDKDIFRRDLGGIDEAYKEVLSRIKNSNLIIK
jgi:phosphoribosylaminoimidazole-succinocarboxamide synthase